MQFFETILLLLLGAALVSSFAKQFRIPYPALLAIGGALVALLPSAPRLDFPPNLILTIFVAPVLMEAAFSTSLRDLRNTWRPVLSLVLVAVALTTAAVALVARHLLPDMPWPAAIALGALLAPPDAVAATTILREVPLPLRIRMVLEGESMLNDASALLIYRVAVGAATVGTFSVGQAMPMFALVVFGSVALGLILAWPANLLMARFEDAPSAVIFQFGLTFGIWLGSDHLGLSPIVTVVAFALAIARKTMFPVPARIRLATFAIWESATVILNVLAFTLIGLQLGPILDALTGEQRTRSIGFALVILAVVIGIRLVLVLTHHAFSRRNGRLHDAGSGPTASQPLTVRGALVVGWAGMRGIVTLAAAMALPAAFPYRNFIQLTAFVVVLGTLVLQGFTLRPLLALVRLPLDHTLRQELGLARETVLRAALAELSNHDGPAADQLRQELADALSDTQRGRNPGDSPHNVLRCRLVATCRDAIEELRTSGAIGDDAYRQVEARLDWVELSARSHDDEDSRPSPTLG